MDNCCQHFVIKVNIIAFITPQPISTFLLKFCCFGLFIFVSDREKTCYQKFTWNKPQLLRNLRESSPFTVRSTVWVKYTSQQHRLCVRFTVIKCLIFIWWTAALNWRIFHHHGWENYLWWGLWLHKNLPTQNISKWNCSTTDIIQAVYQRITLPLRGWQGLQKVGDKYSTQNY